MYVTVTVTGIDTTNERLSALGASFRDFTEALALLGRQLIMFYSSTVFTSEGQALGQKWAPLAASTQAYKDAHWEGRGILQRTGALQHAFYATNTADTLTVGNNASYFSYHQLGTRKMPQRQIIGVNARVETMIKSVLEADIRAKIAGAGL